MSDTPRTDEAEANAIDSGIPISMVCRQLERELNQAIKKRDIVIQTLLKELNEAISVRDEGLKLLRLIADEVHRSRKAARKKKQ